MNIEAKTENTWKDYLEITLCLPFIVAGFIFEKICKWFWVGRKCGEL